MRKFKFQRTANQIKILKVFISFSNFEEKSPHYYNKLDKIVIDTRHTNETDITVILMIKSSYKGLWFTFTEVYFHQYVALIHRLASCNEK